MTPESLPPRPAVRDAEPSGSLEEEWLRLRRTLELESSSWSGWIFAEDLRDVACLRQRTEAFFASRNRRLSLINPQTPGSLVDALRELLQRPAPEVGLVWVEACVLSPDAMSEAWNDAWAQFLLRANEHRDELRGPQNPGVVFVARPEVKATAREAAPDLWSTRSLVIEIARRHPEDPPRLYAPMDFAPAPSSERADDLAGSPEAFLREAERIVGDDLPARRSRAEARLGAGHRFLSRGDAQQALREFVSAWNDARPIEQAEPTLALEVLVSLADAEFRDRDAVAGGEHLAFALDIAQKSLQPGLRNAALAIDLSDLALRVGRTPEALRAIEVALRSTEADAAHPSVALQADWVRALVDERRGTILALLGRLPDALTAHSASLVTRRRIAKSNPTNQSARRNVVVALGNVGDTLRASGNYADALRAYQESLEMARSISLDFPGNGEARRDVGIALNRIGDVLDLTGDPSGASSFYRDGFTIFEALEHASPGDPQARRDLAISLVKIGDVLSKQRELQPALSAFESALEISRSLVREDPTNAQAQRDLSVDFNRVADVLVDLGDESRASAAYREALLLTEKLARENPSNAIAQRDLALTWNRVGDLVARRGDPASALSAFEAGMRISETLARDDPGNAVIQRDLVASHSRLAVTKALLGRNEDARTHGEAALRILDELDHPVRLLTSEDRRLRDWLRSWKDGTSPPPWQPAETG